jgi:hypothetical protein
VSGISLTTLSGQQFLATLIEQGFRGLKVRMLVDLAVVEDTHAVCFDARALNTLENVTIIEEYDGNTAEWNQGADAEESP